jgi:hypothetical protein
MNTLKTDSRECQFCGLTFSRVDAARRHAKRCPQRDGRKLLDRKRGRQVKACDQCSRVKVHCSPRKKGPCERCIPRKLPCSFDRYDDGSISPLFSTIAPSEPDGHVKGRIPLSFLLNSTDDQQDYLTERTVALEPDGVPLGPALLSSSFAPEYGLLDFIDPSLLSLLDYSSSTTPMTPNGSSNTNGEHYLADFACTRPWEALIAARLELLENDLATHVGQNLDYLGPFDFHTFRTFFSIPNVRMFITKFCCKRHYRYPIIHWPTFESERVSLTLLVVVCLTGAAYSLSEEHGAAHAIQARTFYKLADSYVFQNLERHLHSISAESEATHTLEHCQAALLMYALDTLPAGDMAMQHTAVARRLPSIITAMRELRFTTVQHEPFEDWLVFVHREQIIRLVAWTFCADCLATLSCNKPPGFTVLEMRGSLPCGPKLWDADATFFPLLQDHPNESAPLCLADLMSHWLNGDLDTSVNASGLPIFHLHVMLCGKSSPHMRRV